mgnify:FL=1
MKTAQQIAIATNKIKSDFDGVVDTMHRHLVSLGITIEDRDFDDMVEAMDQCWVKRLGFPSWMASEIEEWHLSGSVEYQACDEWNQLAADVMNATTSRLARGTR